VLLSGFKSEENMRFTEVLLDQMREELANPALMRQRIAEREMANKMVERCKQMFVEEGRNFDAEFAEYQRQNRRAA
jgi:hypothetical protein